MTPQPTADSQKWVNIGLGAAIAAFLTPIVILVAHAGGAGASLRIEPVQSAVVLVALVLSLGLQGIAILRILRREPGAILFGRKAAIYHAIFALALFVLAAAIKPLSNSIIVGAWAAAWLGPGNIPTGFLPLFLLTQRDCLLRADPNYQPRELWRGVAVVCLAFNAVLGLWTFAPISGGPWHLFDSSTAAFFNVGVIVHLIAIWQLAVRARFAWLWSSVVGAACLGSGFALSASANRETLLQPNSVAEIGKLLNIGWFQLAPYLPIIAYALTTLAGVMLYRASKNSS